MRMNINEIVDSAPNRPIIQNTLMKTDVKLTYYRNPVISVSGGSDSDIMIDIVERVRGDRKVIYVWFDTGIEYDATERHLDDLEKRYDIEIRREKAVVPVPVGCKRYGLPFISKRVSMYIDRLQGHGFDWVDEPFDVLYKKYPKCKSALKWWCNAWDDKDGKPSHFNIKNHKYLKEFMIENLPKTRFSKKCCDGAKEKTGDMIDKLYDAGIKLQGLRQAEGGQRATGIESCFSAPTDKKIAQYRPLYFWTDDDKAIYKQWAKLVNSDCYEVWGMTRTGCAGCPLGSRFEEELKLIHQYEPKLETAVNNIFGKSYEYTRQYRE